MTYMYMNSTSTGYYCMYMTTSPYSSRERAVENTRRNPTGQISNRVSACFFVPHSSWYCGHADPGHRYARTDLPPVCFTSWRRPTAGISIRTLLPCRRPVCAAEVAEERILRVALRLSEGLQWHRNPGVCDGSTAATDRRPLSSRTLTPTGNTKRASGRADRVGQG